MKFYIYLLVAGCILGSCSKTSSNNSKCTYIPSTIVAPAGEQQSLKDSLDLYSIQATKDSSGFYYTINDPGTDPKPKDLCSTIAAYYKLTYFNGNGIDSTSGTPAVFLLGNVIPGWQKGISKVGKGGKIDLYIPPSLAYGHNDYSVTIGGVTKTIPGDSYLIFHVTVAEVQ